MTELLAPAGSPESLDAAIGEGADAVYLGLKDFNARMRSANFTYPQFEGALRSLHRMGKKLYVTVNTVFEHREADRVYQLLKYLAGLGPDGIMVQDFGIITMARENFPSLKLFASTQMNVASARGVNFLSRHGFSRVVLARELSLEEISEIRANTNMELEVFIHGALCVSVSGICLFSSYLGGKSANRGMCTQACRRFFSAPDSGTASMGGAGDLEGGYYFSPSDLELIEQVPALVKAGVDSFKIEGRMKSAEYVGSVVSAYRLVLDSIEGGEEKLNEAMKEARGILKNDFARTKTAYLINGINTGLNAPGAYDWLNPKQSGGTGINLGDLLKVREKGGEMTGLVKSSLSLSPGDSIRLHRADDSDRVSHKLSSADKSSEGHWISIPQGFVPGDSVFLIQTKSMSKRYPPVIPRDRELKGRNPGRDKAPLPQEQKKDESPDNKTSADKSTAAKSPVNKSSKGSAGRNRARAELPGGLYVMVSRIEDLYILQSSRPEKVILSVNRKVLNQIIREQVLPFPPRDMIISLDPFFPQNRDNELDEAVSALLAKGYAKFIVNNLGHFSLLRGKSDINKKEKITIIAGPWLYTFNYWAFNFINSSGAEYCVSPLENNRQNLERTFPKKEQRGQVFITILSQPSLFRMRPDLGRVYDFKDFSDNMDMTFRLTSSAEGTLVYPGDYFSIVDKIPFLREAGFSRFILDLSMESIKKAEYRDLMEAVSRARPLPNISRFNWKNGFFREPN